MDRKPAGIEQYVTEFENDYVQMMNMIGWILGLEQLDYSLWSRNFSWEITLLELGPTECYTGLSKEKLNIFRARMCLSMHACKAFCEGGSHSRQNAKCKPFSIVSLCLPTFGLKALSQRFLFLFWWWIDMIIHFYDILFENRFYLFMIRSISQMHSVFKFGLWFLKGCWTGLFIMVL